MGQQDESNEPTKSSSSRSLRRSTQLALVLALAASATIAVAPLAHANQPAANALPASTPNVSAQPISSPHAVADGSSATGSASTAGPTARPADPLLDDATASPTPSSSSKPTAATPAATQPSPADDAAAVPGEGHQRYDLAATLDYAASTLDVRETLDWTNTANVPVGSLDLSVIPAHVRAFQLTGPVTTDGTTADAHFVQYDTNLHVPFAKPVTSGSQVRIVVPFRLNVAKNAGALGGRLTNQRGTIQFGEWFPIWSTRHGFSDIGEPQLTWNADEIALDLTSVTDLGADAVASSGDLLPGSTASHWVFIAHNVRDFAFAVNPGYSVAIGTVQCDGRSVEIRSYSSQVPASTLVLSAIKAMTAYDSSFGCYAYSTFSIAEVGSPWFSMEFPTLVFIGARVATTQAVIYHEVAHQWWYGMVGNDQINEPWLDEGFAEFSAQTLSTRAKACSSGAVASTVYAFSSWSPCGQYVQTVYERGAEFLWAVRAALGDDSFFGAMRSIVGTYQYGIATTSGVLSIFSQASEVDLSQIFQTYGFAQS